MIRILFGVFLILHGLVHLLYLGQSARFFELQPGMVWPDGSWAFSSLVGETGIRNLASILLMLATIGFVAGGIGVYAKQGWGRPAVVAAAVISSVLYVLFWDGAFQHLDNKGGVGVLINLAILAALLVVQRPELEF